MNAFQKYEAYKPSGVEWIGEVPSNWQTKKLKFFGNTFAGLTGKKGDDFSKEYVEGMKPFIPFTNICNNRTISDEQYQYVKVKESEVQNRVKKNDILFLMSSETLEDIARCSIYLGDNSELYLNSFCKGFRLNTRDLNPEYVNYLLFCTSYRNYFSLVGRGFTRINLKQEYINDAIILIPPLPEQTRIAHFLDQKTAQIDQAIAQKERLIELLKERRQILIHNAVTRGLNPNVLMKDSGVEWIGEVPEHWEVKMLKYIFKEIDNRTKTGNEELLSLRMNIGLIPHDDVSDTEITDANLIGYKVVKSGQMVMNRMRASIGIFGIATQDGLVSPDYSIYENIGDVYSEYYLQLFKTAMMGIVFRINSKGLGTGSSGFMRLYNQHFGTIKVCLPSKNEQCDIVEQIKIVNEKIDTAIACKQAEIEKLKEYKATLINSAVTGKIKVSSE